MVVVEAVVREGASLVAEAMAKEPTEEGWRVDGSVVVLVAARAVKREATDSQASAAAAARAARRAVVVPTAQELQAVARLEDGRAAVKRVVVAMEEVVRAAVVKATDVLVVGLVDETAVEGTVAAARVVAVMAAEAMETVAV